MYNLKKSITTTPITSMESELNLTEYHRTVASLESDIERRDSLLKYEMLTNNMTTYGIEAVAILQLSANILGVSDSAVSSMESNIGSSTPSFEGFASTAKDVGTTILEKIKSLISWIMSVFKKDVSGELDEIEKLAIGVTEDKKELVSTAGAEIKSITVVSESTAGSDEVATLAKKESAVVSPSISYDQDKKTMVFRGTVAAYFDEKIDDAVWNYLDELGKVMKSFETTGDTDAGDMLLTYTKLFETLSTKGTYSEGDNTKVLLDLLPTNPLLVITLPKVKDNEFITAMSLASADSVNYTESKNVPLRFETETHWLQVRGIKRLLTFTSEMTNVKSEDVSKSYLNRVTSDRIALVVITKKILNGVKSRFLAEKQINKYLFKLNEEASDARKERNDN